MRRYIHIMLAWIIIKAFTILRKLSGIHEANGVYLELCNNWPEFEGREE
jgi:hypothetical protein